LVVDVVRTRAENGDIRGARIMAARFADSRLRAWAIEAITAAQVRQGDLRGALETLSRPEQAHGCPVVVAAGGIEIKDPLPDAIRVLETFGARQFASGDLRGP